MRCLVPALCLLLAAGFARAEKVLVYRAQAEGSGRVTESFDPTFLSRDLPIDVETPDDLDGRLRLVDPEHGGCCCAIL